MPQKATFGWLSFCLDPIDNIIQFSIIESMFNNM